MGEGQPNFETSKIRGILSVKFFLLFNCTSSRWLELAFHGWFSLRMIRCSTSIFFHHWPSKYFSQQDCLKVVGYAYANMLKDRRAYDKTVETSVYTRFASFKKEMETSPQSSSQGAL